MDTAASRRLSATSKNGGFGGLENTRRIFLRNFDVSISMGVHDFEKQAR